MIATVTLNLALDVTYQVRQLVLESSVRVDEVKQRAGGKGVNVARILHALGAPVVVTGFVGGRTGAVVRADLVAAGLEHRLVRIDGETRRTVAVVDAEGRVTILLEPGPAVDADRWARFLVRFESIARRAKVVVLAGSLPPGLPLDAYGQLVASAHSVGCETILDAAGAPFVAALAAGPVLVKPNRDELYEVTGGGGPTKGGSTDLADVIDRADRLRSIGAGGVVVSLGQDGVVALTDGGAWHATLPTGTAVAGNPTGAGDAVVAALACGLADGDPWRDRIREAVALSAAAVLHPLAGSFDAAAHARLRDLVQIREIPRTSST